MAAELILLHEKMNHREFLRDYYTLISVLSLRVVWESEPSLCVTDKFEEKC